MIISLAVLVGSKENIDLSGELKTLFLEEKIKNIKQAKGGLFTAAFEISQKYESLFHPSNVISFSQIFPCKSGVIATRIPGRRE
jgi:hypothetical protein